MLLLAWLGIRWSVWLMIIPPVLIGLSRGGFRRERRKDIRLGGAARFALMILLLTLGAATYAAATARATSFDLLFFWGTKGQRFAQKASIDVNFLGDPAHCLMHADYPPMLPCLYAWATLVTGRFAWGAALLSLPLFLALAVLTFFGFARSTLGRDDALEQASILAVLLALVLIEGYTAGGAEPLLVYFEVVALSALVFAADRPEGMPAAAVGLAGAAVTKVEGLVFAALLIGAVALFLRGSCRWRPLALLAGTPTIFLAAWVIFCRSHGLLESYDLPARSRATLVYLPIVLREVGRGASYSTRFAPWIAVLALAVRGKRSPVSLIALAVALGFAGFTVLAYLTSKDDPRQWIVWSASGVLGTPLVSLFFWGAARASVVTESPRQG